MDDAEFADAHDRHLADFKSYQDMAYCTNPECLRYGEPVPVNYTEEYGVGDIRPEECDDCRGELDLEPPPEQEEEEG